LIALESRLSRQLADFENLYSMNSTDFYARFQAGVAGDDMDFIEWASTIEMLDDLRKSDLEPIREEIEGLQAARQAQAALEAWREDPSRGHLYSEIRSELVTEGLLDG